MESAKEKRSKVSLAGGEFNIQRDLDCLHTTLGVIITHSPLLHSPPTLFRLSLPSYSYTHHIPKQGRGM